MTKPTILRYPDVVKRLTVSKAKLFDMIAKGQFPKPFTLVPGGRTVGWLETNVDEWILARSSAGARLATTDQEKSETPTRRPLTVGDLIDYLSQFDPKAAVFVDYGPLNKTEVDKHEAKNKPYIVLDQIDFYVED